MTEKEKKTGIPKNGMNGKNANGTGAETGRDEPVKTALEKQVERLEEETGKAEKRTAELGKKADKVAREAAELDRKCEELEEKTGKIVEENDMLRDRALRIAADFDNYKKRSETEKTRARLEGTLEMAAAVFAVMDSLELALRHASAENADTESLTEGVRLTYEQSVSQLASFGINQISAKIGDKFDPSVHQAIENRPSDEIKKGCVAEEISKGYRAGETLVRPVAVAVSSGTPEKTGE